MSASKVAPMPVSALGGGGGARLPLALATTLCPAPARTPCPATARDLPPAHCRVYTATDLHVDYAANMQWCERVAAAASRRRLRNSNGDNGDNDVLLLCGDVSDELGTLEAALRLLAARFRHLFYIPGNHELWVREADRSVGPTVHAALFVMCALCCPPPQPTLWWVSLSLPLPPPPPLPPLLLCRAAGIRDSLDKLQRVLELCGRLGVHTGPRRVTPHLWIVPLWRCAALACLGCRLAH